MWSIEQKVILLRCRTYIRDEPAMMLFDALYLRIYQSYGFENLTQRWHTFENCPIKFSEISFDKRENGSHFSKPWFRTIFDIFSLRTRKQLRFFGNLFFSCEGTLKVGLESSQRCMQLEIFVREECVIKSIFYNFSAHFDTFLHNNLKLLEYPPICSYHIRKRIKCLKNHINFV